MTTRPLLTGARITTVRRLAWADTDAAGHNHFGVAIRWLEEAEHALWRALSLPHLVPTVPRVHLEIDYRDRVHFGDAVALTLGLADMGRTSATFSFAAQRGDTCVIEGSHVVAHCPDPTAGSMPWPTEVRTLLSDPAQDHHLDWR